MKPDIRTSYHQEELTVYELLGYIQDEQQPDRIIWQDHEYHIEIGMFGREKVLDFYSGDHTFTQDISEEMTMWQFLTEKIIAVWVD